MVWYGDGRMGEGRISIEGWVRRKEGRQEKTAKEGGILDAGVASAAASQCDGVTVCLNSNPAP